jgi:hypothetical protein
MVMDTQKQEILEKLTSLKEEVTAFARKLPYWVRAPRSADEDTKFLARLLSGGRVINEPVMHNAPLVLDMIINRLDVDPGQLTQTSLDMMDVQVNSFKDCVARTSVKEFGKLTKIFNQHKIAKHKNLVSAYVDFTQKSEAIKDLMETAGLPRKFQAGG